MSQYSGPTAASRSANALSTYDAAAATEKATILADTSLDSVSKQELIAQLAAGDNAIVTEYGGTNSTTYDQLAQEQITAVQNQVVEDASDDPVYQGRRYLEQQYIQQQNQPGSAQTILTQRTNTPAGTPTLLTSGPGGSGGVNLTTPGSNLTGKS